MSYFWLTAVVLFAIVEAATMGINFIWFSVGSLAAMICAMLGGRIWLQAVVFVVVTAVTLLYTKPLVKKYIQGRHQPTNADRIIGSTGVVTENIDNMANVGQIRVNGQIWSAKRLGDTPIAENTRVELLSIAGVKAVVKPIN
jgi:membrane protein implicated in regulation of membrane protease activity